jgi:hypothetical protein
MDYPPPYVTIGEDGAIDLSRAYGSSFGEWDKRAILYGYQHFRRDGRARGAQRNPGGEPRERFALHHRPESRAPAGGAHPTAHLWDTGKSAVDELNRW